MPDPGVTIGIVRDKAFQFYYPENIQSLVERGARVVEISALEDRCLPDIDALYIGGGFPETQAARLAGNESFSVHSGRRPKTDCRFTPNAAALCTWVKN